MSVPSANVTSMLDSPYSETERVTTRYGKPFSSVSIGTVISRSTSSAAWPGHCVVISTIGGDTSGYASTGRRLSEKMPTPMIASDDERDEQRLVERRLDEPLNRPAVRRRARRQRLARRTRRCSSGRSVGSLTGSPRTGGRARLR